MIRIVTLFSIMLIVLFSFSSCVSKRFTKQAKQYEDMGQYSQAANYYYEAFVSDRTNIEAFSGLKRTSQLTLSKKLSDFNRAYNQENNQEAIAYYDDAMKYYEKINKLDIQLNFPSFYTDYYNEVKNTYLEDVYYEGIIFLDQDKFSEAEKSFKEVIKLQPTYKDVKEKLNVAIYEPKYREGIKNMEQEKYRKAYYIFKEIVDYGNSYRDSFDLQKEALEKGTVAILVTVSKNTSSYPELKSVVENKIINSLQSYNNPFLKIVGGTSSSDLTLNCEITNYKYDQGSLKKTEKPGYKKKTIRVLNQESQNYENRIEYDKISYSEYSMTRSINMAISYKLINNKTREIHKSNSKSFRSYDEINYARYDGDASLLVPGYWNSRTASSSKDKVLDNHSDVRMLQSLFSARSQIKDYNTISSEVIKSSTSFISNEINKFIVEN